MAGDALRALVGILRRKVQSPSDEPTDGELLRRFSQSRDEDAFALLVGRHGSLVLGVCQRILGDHHHAEDCFQATFLVLADRAGRLVNSGSVAGWLHEVAVRVSRKSRTRLARLARRDRAAMRPESIDVPQTIGLDEEVNRLPAAYRDAVTLCYLQSRSTEEAAALLGCTPDGLRGRLHRAKQILRDRLRSELPSLSGVSLPAGLIERTTAALTAPVATVSSLSRGVIWSMFLTRMIGPLIAMTLLTIAVPVAVLAGQKLTTRDEAPTNVSKHDSTDDPEPPVSLSVRALHIKDIPTELLGGNQVIVYRKPHELSELGGRQASAEMRKMREEVAGKVTFGREIVVLARYSTGGPPFGVLKYKVHPKKREIEFYVTPGGIATALKQGAEFFTVPAGTTVKWGEVKE